MAKNILLSITGMTPQVITETLYGIYRNNCDLMPEEIHVITTEDGEMKLRNKLLGKGGKLEQFYKDYELSPINFETDVHIHVIEDAEGRRISDARSKEDQKVIADFIYKEVRKLTDELDEESLPKYRIHASIAGGRKTMTYLLGSAMNMLANREDCMSHVLVSSEFENVPEFYYPTLEQYMVQKGDKQRGNIEFLDARYAKVELSEIPLIRLRSLLQNNIGFNFLDSYNEAVSSINFALSLKSENQKLELVTAECKLVINGLHEVILNPMEFAIYRMYLENVKHEGKYEKPTKKGFGAQRQRVIRMYETVFKYAPIIDRDALKCLRQRIDEYHASYENEDNYDFLVDIVDKTNYFLNIDQKKRNVKLINFETLSSRVDNKTFNLLHPKLEWTNEVTDNESFLQSHYDFWTNRFKNIGNKLSQAVKCTELAELFKIKPHNGFYRIGISLKNIIVDGQSFIDMKDEEL